jgi:formylglycine-generating enzyme required for sulfatase activity
MKKMKKAFVFLRVLFVAVLAVLPLSGQCRVIYGDVNHDGSIDINDVTLLIDYVLTGDDSKVDVVACNITHMYDVYVNITDITKLIDMVLTGDYYCPPAELTIPEGSVTYTVNGVSFQMVPVEGGTFMMGDSAQRETRPVHEVTLSNYWIGLTEVTVGLWRAVMGSTPYALPDDDQPLYNVSHYECEEFVSRLSEMTGQNFSLPTEAQWEFAARGGNLSHGYLFSGSDDIDEVAWYGDNCPGGLPQYLYPVGCKKPNELGLYDMTGSVEEHCRDNWYGYISYRPEPIDPLYVSSVGSDLYVVRGGDWFRVKEHCTVYYRSFMEGWRTVSGLRLAICTAEPTPIY